MRFKINKNSITIQFTREEFEFVSKLFNFVPNGSSYWAVAFALSKVPTAWDAFKQKKFIKL